MNTFIHVNNNSPEWEYVYNIAKNDNTHGLWGNYQNIDLDEYETMVVTLRDNEPAAFHGIFNNNRWPTNISRICNRAYILPKFRDNNEGLDITSVSIKYVLDNYDKWGKDILFISRGVQYNNPAISYKKFEKFNRFVEQSTGYKFKYTDRLYRGCKDNCKECFQYFLFYDPKDLLDTIHIDTISQDEWVSLP